MKKRASPDARLPRTARRSPAGPWDAWQPGRAANYYRTSSDEQEEMGTIDTQRREVRRHQAKQGLVVSEELEFFDDGVTGLSEITSRPGGTALIQAAREGKFDTLYVYKISRLGREAYYILHADHLLRQAGIHLQSVTEPFDPRTATGRFLVTLWAANAGLERDNIVQQTSAGTERCLEEGYWMGGRVPFGYKCVPDGKRKRIALCEEEIPGHPGWSPGRVIRYIWERTLKDRATAGQIGAELAAWGLPTCWVPGDLRYDTPHYGLWGPTRVANILRSQTYAGQHLYGKPRATTLREEPVTRACPAYVTHADWLLAQEILKSHQTLSKKNSKRFYLLRGFMQCGRCGCNYLGTASINGRSGKQHPERRYYRCSSACHGPLNRAKREEGPCRSQYVHADELEAIVRTDLTQILLNPGAVIERLRERIGAATESRGSLQAQSEQLQAERRKVALQELEYLRLRAAGHIRTDAQLATLQGELHDRLTTLDGMEADLRTRLNAASEADSHLEAAAAYLAETGHSIPPAEDEAAWRQLVERLLLRITVHTDDTTRPKGVRVVIEFYTGPMSQLFTLPVSVTFATATHWARQGDVLGVAA